MSEYTPGPWRVVWFRFKGPLHIMSADGRYVMDGNNASHARVRREADAALVSAAPDLLEALQALIHEDGGSLAHSAEHPKCVAARAAIAKAIPSAEG